ncbi:MAG TPA: heme-copper oxidase subunit III [Thermomicrobiales bacterium]|nr:heme-copper oxidase subunit III [Thermomicrobiales bacterium]
MATTTLDVQHAGGAVDHGHGHGDSGHGPTSTGIDSKKLLMWWFLGSDGVLFGALIATFMIYRNRAQDLSVGETVAGLVTTGGPFPNEILDQLFTAVSAGVLLFSSFTMVLAVASIGRGNIKAFRVWTIATAMLGGIFLAGQYFEYTEFFHEGLSLQQNIFGASFFVLTGVHGLHVFAGVLWLLGLSLTSFRGGISKKDHTNVEVAGLYWHFIDIVWIVLFTLVYLLPYRDGAHDPEHVDGAMRLVQAIPFF